MLPNRSWVMLRKNIQKLTCKYILRQRELSRHFQHQYCIAKAAQNWLQRICTLNCIFDALLYTKYPHLSVSTSTCISHSFSLAFDVCIYVALYSRVQFGQRKKSQHFCFSDKDTTFTAPHVFTLNPLKSWNQFKMFYCIKHNL